MSRSGPTFREASDVAELAQPLIDTVHHHLADVPVRYVFRSTATMSKGREVWGRARLVTGLNAHLAGPIIAGGLTWSCLFVIEIAEDIWALLDERQRQALVDHELTHCAVDEDDEGVKLRIRGHDVEEFAGVIRRWGLWSDSVKRFAEPMRLALQES